MTHIEALTDQGLKDVITGLLQSLNQMKLKLEVVERAYIEQSIERENLYKSMGGVSLSLEMLRGEQRRRDFLKEKKHGPD